MSVSHTSSFPTEGAAETKVRFLLEGRRGRGVGRVQAEGEIKRRKLVHRGGAELQTGYKVMCKCRDGKYRKAKIIERRVKDAAPTQPTLTTASVDEDQFQYYVHYLDCVPPSPHPALATAVSAAVNRRMDEWVSADRLDLNTIEVVVTPENSEDEKPPAEDTDGMRTRSSLRRRGANDDSQDKESDGKMDIDEKCSHEHDDNPKVKTVEWIELGKYEIETWYYSPLPQLYQNCKFFKRRSTLLRHLRKLKFRHPPGDEIYRKNNVCVFEIDGRKEGVYCQNLCYLSKMFLDHKTLYYDVDLFLFYVLCEIDDRGAHIVGYFSKEKHSEEGYNLACILTLPPYQRKGYGKFLISFSYELSKIERRVGTPERPLSDLGLVSYRQYWSRVLLKLIMDINEPISLNDLSERSAIKVDDVVSTLQRLNMLHYKKGQHVIYAPMELIYVRLQEAGSPGLVVDPDLIMWVPYDARAEYATFRS